MHHNASLLHWIMNKCTQNIKSYRWCIMQLPLYCHCLWKWTFHNTWRSFLSNLNSTYSVIYFGVPRIAWWHWIYSCIILAFILCSHWILGMEKLFYPTLYKGCNQLSILGLRSSHTMHSSGISFWALFEPINPYVMVCVWEMDWIYEHHKTSIKSHMSLWIHKASVSSPAMS